MLYDVCVAEWYQIANIGNHGCIWINCLEIQKSNIIWAPIAYTLFLYLYVVIMRTLHTNWSLTNKSSILQHLPDLAISEV